MLKWLHYPLEVMLVCVRWYAAYPLSLRLTLPLESVPHNRVMNWLAWVGWQAILARTSLG